MAVRGWHPGKIALCGSSSLASRFCLQSADIDRGWRRPSDTVWFLFIVFCCCNNVALAGRTRRSFELETLPKIRDANGRPAQEEATEGLPLTPYSSTCHR